MVTYLILLSDSCLLEYHIHFYVSSMYLQCCFTFFFLPGVDRDVLCEMFAIVENNSENPKGKIKIKYHTL